MDVSGVYTLSI